VGRGYPALRPAATFDLVRRRRGSPDEVAPDQRDLLRAQSAICFLGHTSPASIDEIRPPPPGADDRQVSAQHIKELRQAVDVHPAKKRANSSGGRVIPKPRTLGKAFCAEPK